QIGRGGRLDRDCAWFRISLPERAAARLMRLRAYQRLFLSYLVLVVALVATLLFGIDRLVRHSLMAMVEDDLHRELFLAREIYRTAPPASADSVAELIGSLTGRRATIVGPDGEVRGESTLPFEELGELENHAERPEIRAALEGRLGRSIRSSATVDARLLYLAIANDRGEVVRLSVPLTMVDEPIDQLQRGVLIIGAIAIALSA